MEQCLINANGFVVVTRQDDAGPMKVSGEAAKKRTVAAASITASNSMQLRVRVTLALVHQRQAPESMSCLVQSLMTVLAPYWFAEESIPSLIPSETLIALHSGIQGLRTNCTKLGDAGQLCVLKWSDLCVCAAHKLLCSCPACCLHVSAVTPLGHGKNKARAAETVEGIESIWREVSARLEEANRNDRAREVSQAAGLLLLAGRVDHHIRTVWWSLRSVAAEFTLQYLCALSGEGRATSVRSGPCPPAYATQAEVRAARAELAAHRAVVDKCEKLTKEV
jgi:hypothetical protein